MSDLLQAFKDNEGLLRRVIYRICRRQEDVNDLLQETFLRAFAAQAHYEIEYPKAFLVKVATNLALSHIKNKAQAQTDYLEDTQLSGGVAEQSDTASDEIFEGREKLVVFAHAVASLPPRCRQVFLMRKFEGLKLKQIATRLNLSLSMVEKHVKVGLIKCSQFMRNEGYDLSDIGAQHLEQTLATQSSVAHKKARNRDDEKQ